MVLRLDAAIDKVEDLSRDVELDRIDKRDMDKSTEPVAEEINHLLAVTAVAEPSEYQYGAEVFEAAYPKMQEKNVETTMKNLNIPKTGKLRQKLRIMGIA